jgi:hypothetical protein
MANPKNNAYHLIKLQFEITRAIHSKNTLIAPQSQPMPTQPPPTTHPLAQLLFIPLLAFLLSGCSTYQKVYTNDPNKQIKRRADIILRW